MTEVPNLAIESTRGLKVKSLHCRRIRRLAGVELPITNLGVRSQKGHCVVTRLWSLVRDNELRPE